MSETKHSPEPWRVCGDTVVSGSSTVVESPWTCPGDDLRRIVAAVNAVSGIPSESLEGGYLDRALQMLVALRHGTRLPDDLSRDLDDTLRALGRLP